LGAAPLAAALQHGPAATRGVPGRLGQQARLPQPRLTGQEEDRRSFSRLVSLQPGKLARATDQERGGRAGRMGDAGGGARPGSVVAWSAQRGTGGGPARAGLECRPRLAEQPERIGEQPDGVLVGRPADAALDVADAAGAHAGALGQLLLRQARGRSVASSQVPEGRGWSTVHASPHPHVTLRRTQPGGTVPARDPAPR
jgi:hypothetical protein